jgi:small subunit ribosomal protein S3
LGQKVHPYGFRLGYNKDWHSHWFAKKQYGDFLIEDLRLKRELKKRFTGAGVSHVDIERAANRLKIIIYTSRPGIIIGRKGAEIDKLKGDISSRTGREVLVSIQEIHKPELNAQLQAEKIAAQLEKRIAFRRAMRKAVEESLRFGAQGIKVKVSGRLNGAEIARSLFVHAFNLVEDATGFDHCDPIFGSALAFAHARFRRLLRHRFVGKHANPNLAAAFDVARHGNARCFNLTIGDPRGFQSLQTVLAEADHAAAIGDARHAAAHLLTMLNFFRHQHS